MPDDKDMPKEITLYEESDWRMDGMTLLDFLRRTNKDGKIINWLVKKHKKSCPDNYPGLEFFANNYAMFGEQLVAADMLSWRNDRRIGQWLMLNIPFRQHSDFYHPDLDNKVPADYRYLAMA
eukprot:9448712-Karenia_brevis.AAC.1